MCVFVRVCVFAQTHTATLGAMETLRNGRGAAGYRLPVTHDLADCGSSAHYGRGRVRETDEIICVSSPICTDRAAAVISQ